MLIPLPNITYNVQDAIDYYTIVKDNFQDLKLTKREANEIASFSDDHADERIESFFNVVGRVEPFVSWTKEQIFKFLTEKSLEYTGKSYFWFIKHCESHPKIDRQSELHFGFAKRLLDLFPESSEMEIVVNPVGTHYHRHTDNDDLLRIIIPIISDSGAVWHFDEKQNVTHTPGNAYMLLKQFPHATDVLGPSDRVSIHFQLPAKSKEWVTTLNRSL
jgi:predicted house-cleaning noncanonical NTP pyrophosphatase (MazG superfamily)